MTQCEKWLALKIEEGRSPLKRNRKEGGGPETRDVTTDARSEQRVVRKAPPAITDFGDGEGPPAG